MDFYLVLWELRQTCSGGLLHATILSVTYLIEKRTNRVWRTLSSSGFIKEWWKHEWKQKLWFCLHHSKVVDSFLNAAPCGGLDGPGHGSVVSAEAWGLVSSARFTLDHCLCVFPRPRQCWSRRLATALGPWAHSSCQTEHTSYLVLCCVCMLKVFACMLAHNTAAGICGAECYCACALVCADQPKESITEAVWQLCSPDAAEYILSQGSAISCPDNTSACQHLRLNSDKLYLLHQQ